jgi:hypothetical protein
LINGRRLLFTETLSSKIPSNLFPNDRRGRISPGIANKSQFLSDNLLDGSGWLQDEGGWLLDDEAEDSGGGSGVVLSSALVLPLVVGINLMEKRNMLGVCSIK